MARLRVYVRTRNRDSAVFVHRDGGSSLILKAHPWWGRVVVDPDEEERYIVALKATDGTTVELHLDTQMLLALRGMIDWLVEHILLYDNYDIYENIPKVIE